MKEISVATCEVSRTYFCVFCSQPLACCFCLAVEMARPVNGGDAALTEAEVRLLADELRRQIDDQICRSFAALEKEYLCGE